MPTIKDDKLVEKKNINISSSTTNLGYVPALYGLKCIAILMIMFLHANFFLGRNGKIGLDIFFTISGFLITTLILEEIQLKGDFSLKNFYYKRIVRLLPALYTMLALVLIYAFQLQSIEKWMVIKEVISSALYIHNFVHFWWPDYHPIIVGHTSTLAIVEQFYLIWPLLIFLLLKYFNFKWLKIALYTLFIISCLLHFVNNKSFTTLHSSCIIWGSIIALLRFSGNVKSIHPVMALVSFVFLVLLGFLPTPILKPDFWLTHYIHEIVGFSTSILILSFANAQSFLNTILSSKIPVFIGKISYALYVFHAPIFFLFLKIYTIYHWPPYLVFFLKFIVSFIVAIFFVHIVEKRIINRNDFLYEKR
jgi:peptidoglycan/LPS O-acetylase OafA/YrhL